MFLLSCVVHIISANIHTCKSAAEMLSHYWLCRIHPSLTQCRTYWIIYCSVSTAVYTVKDRRHTPWSCVRCHGCRFTHSQFHSRWHSLRINLNIQHWCPCAVVTREPWNRDNRASDVWALTAYSHFHIHFHFNITFNVFVSFPVFQPAAACEPAAEGVWHPWAAGSTQARPHAEHTGLADTWLRHGLRIPEQCYITCE